MFVFSLKTIISYIISTYYNNLLTHILEDAKFIFLMSGILSSKENILPAAFRPCWKLGEKDKALPIDHDPVITASATLPLN